MTDHPHFQEDLLAFLCCPDCKGSLTLVDSSSLNCAVCAHDFPILDGVPDLRPVLPDPKETEES